MVWPIRPVIPAMIFQGIGLTLSAKELRVAKHHLDTGCIVYLARFPDEIAAIVSRSPHERTTEAGTLLNDPAHMSHSQANPLAPEIGLVGFG